MIKTIKCKETQRIYEMDKLRKLLKNTHQRAYKKLLISNKAASIKDLRLTPFNHLEKLSGDRERQYRIRINDQ